MSTQAVIGFVEHVAASHDLEKEFDAIAQLGIDGAERMSEFGGKHGFEFSGEEFAQVAQAALDASGGELSEAELGRVSGGSFANCFQSTGIILNSASALKIGNIQQLP